MFFGVFLSKQLSRRVVKITVGIRMSRQKIANISLISLRNHDNWCNKHDLTFDSLKKKIDFKSILKKNINFNWSINQLNFFENILYLIYHFSHFGRIYKFAQTTKITMKFMKLYHFFTFNKSHYKISNFPKFRIR